MIEHTPLRRLNQLRTKLEILSFHNVIAGRRLEVELCPSLKQLL